jgi:hypothetical protein
MWKRDEELNQEEQIKLQISRAIMEEKNHGVQKGLAMVCDLFYS